MYTLSVGAIFKNEAHSMKEWIEHYLFHGVDHFYLIDDNSTDSSVEILKEYIDRGLVDLFEGGLPIYNGRQTDMYINNILPHISETKWLLMVDLDEFMWSPMNVNMKDTLKLCSSLKQIQVGESRFGSNGYEDQPKSLVAGFTMREQNPPIDRPFKYFIQCDVQYETLGIHIAKFVDHSFYAHESFIIINPEYFTLNHYNCQSKSHWVNVKMTRGDADNWKIRTMDLFDELDFNETEDTRLLEQNAPLLATLGYINK
jgi:hypothetical protein